MAQLVPLGPQVPRVLARRRRLDGDALADGETVAFEADELARIVRDRTDRLESQIEEDLGADAVVAEVRLEAERLVRLDSVGAAVLQLIGLQLVEQADAAPF